MQNKIIEDMPAAEYHSIEALSASGAKMLMKTPAHYLASRVQSAATKAMILGTVVHTMVLEPEKFEAEVAVAPKFDMRTKIGKQAREEFDEDSKGKLVIDEFDYDKARGISDSLRAHPFFKEYVKNGKAETTMLWEQYGVQCKARVDYIAKDVIYDVKTCQDASPAGFARQVANFKYHMQAAHYLMGRKRLVGTNLDPSRFVFLAVESAPPYSVGIYSLTRESLQLGAADMKRAAEQYTHLNDEAPPQHYTDGLQEISLPGWMFTSEDMV